MADRVQERAAGDREGAVVGPAGGVAPPPRRRRLRVVAVALVVGAGLVMVSALGVGAGGAPWTDEGEAVQGHPRRVERPYVVRDLPARPGPVAGLVSDGLSWFAVSSHGRLWRLHDAAAVEQVQPALSADGRMLAYQRVTSGDASEYVVRDLVSGELTAFPQVGNGRDDASFFVAPQHPTYFSPDGEQVLVQGSRLEGRSADALLITDGGVRELFVKGVAWPIGWSPEGRVVWLVTPDREPTRTPEVVATDPDGKEIGRLTLELERPATFHQWSAVLAPDASRLSLVPGDGSGSGQLLELSIPDGRRLDRHPIPDLGGCHPSWRDGEPLVPAPDHALAGLDGDPVVVVDPSIDAHCSVWATDALAGDRHDGVTGTVLGTSTALLSWRWREAAAGLLLLLAATCVLVAGRAPRVDTGAGDRHPG